jgi:lipoyl(octanoyl) transferase
VDVVRLGRTEYRACWDLQRHLQERRCAGAIGDVLLMTEHDPVITLGTTAQPGHLLSSRSVLAREGIDVVECDRGGDVTYHGPGQIIGYPILDLQQRTPDLHLYLRSLEQLVIDALGLFGLSASRVNGYTGVWVGNRKICAIGVNVRRWVTMHGFALNVNTDMSMFQHIIPCGIAGYGVTSLAGMLERHVPLRDVENALLDACARNFHVTLHETTKKELGIESDAFRRTAVTCI